MAGGNPIVVAPRGGPPCKYEANLFEGRRRIDIRLSFHRYGKALRVKGHKLPRKATVCLLHAKRVTGFRNRHFMEVPKLHPLKLWIVRLRRPASGCPSRWRSRRATASPAPGCRS